MDVRNRIEKVLLLLGLLLLSCYVAARIHSKLSSRAELRRFWQVRGTQPLPGISPVSVPAGASPDFRLWSEKRIAAYKLSLASAAPLPLAVLRIPNMNLEVPVLEGTDDFTLNRAVGHIEGTPEPGQDGNVGIAGHRDGFFRALKDIQPGDVIDLVTKTSNTRYVVDEIVIVSPDDVSVLRPRSNPSLTLVTCYPFYFVGSAPKRFIVHASIADPADFPNDKRPSSAGKGGAEENH
jgi:sortase A